MALQTRPAEWHPCLAHFLIDGHVRPEINSGGKVSDWAEHLQAARVRAITRVVAGSEVAS